MCICWTTFCQVIQWLFCCQCLKSTEKSEKKIKVKTKHKTKPKVRTTSPKQTQRSRMSPIKTQPYHDLIKEKELYEVIKLPLDGHQMPESYLQSNGYQLTTDPLGRGHFGQVFKAYKTTGEQQLIACKVIEMSKKRKDDILRELYHQKALEYKYIIEMFAAFVIDFPISNDKRQTNVYLMMAYSADGDLNSVMKKNNRPFNESIAKTYFAQISLAIRYLHKNMIAHRDLKLDNVLLFPSIDNPSIKECRLTDFGLTEPGYTKDKGRTYDERGVGTRLYMPPEVLIIHISKELGEKTVSYRITPVDCWALGVIAYKMLTNKYPFDVRDRPKGKLTKEYIKYTQQVIKKQNNRQIPRDSHVKKGSDAFDLIEWCLEPDTKRRLDIDGIIAHEWLRGETSITQEANNQIKHKSRSKRKTASHR